MACGSWHASTQAGAPPQRSHIRGILRIGSNCTPPYGHAVTHCRQPIHASRSKLIAPVAALRDSAPTGHAVMHGASEHCTQTFGVNSAISSCLIIWIRESGNENAPSFANEHASMQLPHPVHWAVSTTIWPNTVYLLAGLRSFARLIEEPFTRA